MWSLNKVALGALALLGAVSAKEMARDETLAAELYDSGVMMDRIMHMKEKHWAQLIADGSMDSSQWPAVTEVVQCINGTAVVKEGDPKQTFRCNNMDLYSFRSHADLGSKTGQGSSSWGWTSPDGREFVAIAQADGAAFVEITETGDIDYLGRLPSYSKPVIWRELRGFKNYIVIGSESEGHGVQIFDMRKLLGLDPENPKVFDREADLTGHFKGLPVGKTHNMVVNEDTDFVYSVGAVPREGKCAAGLIFINMTDPANPTSPGCAAMDGYVHDAQCVVYQGPQTKYVGREICYGYNEDTLTIYDVTDKTAPKMLSRTSYEGVSYCHQGWVLDKKNQTHLIMDDEFDEVNRKGPAKNGNPTTYIWDITNLEAPKNTGHYTSTKKSVDHNQYIFNGKAYQSNYGSGFAIVDVSSIPRDPTGRSVKEVGFFDVYPEDDHLPGGGRVAFSGSWSSYAGFANQSGYILVNTIERGAFVVKYTGKD